MPDLASYVARAKQATGAYRLNYVLPRVRAPLSRATPSSGTIFILDPAWRGWILDAICREIAERIPGNHRFHYSTENVPAGRSYFIAHQNLVAPVLSNNACVWRGRRVSWFTHPSEFFISQGQFIYALNQLHGVMFQCSLFRDQLVREGVARERTDVLYGGADPQRFLPHARGRGVVGLSMAYYPRKNPDRLLELVSLLAPRRVTLLGRNWTQYPRFDRLVAQPNFTYVEAPYDEYPRYYSEMDVFVSLAQLEGGPIPLIEAMMCNVVPVASRTGIAPDLIRHGDNGFVFDVDAPAATIASLVERAFHNRADIHSTVAHLTWDRFAGRIGGWLGHAAITDSVER
ncbi:MAG TPA: glycosyltransferase family 4 protein [Vicinamibacterales bacterium]|nr:glycosyltransferase family 4 protein [Vicinamibacterales bacterium]